jgi:hypothetical protein
VTGKEKTMKRLLLIALLCATPALAKEKEGMPISGIPGWPEGMGMCVAVKGIALTSCTIFDMTGADAVTVKDLTRGSLDLIVSLTQNAKVRDAIPSLIFPELGDTKDPAAPGSCVCADDSLPIDTGDAPTERPTNSGKGGCTYWMACYIKGVPGPK